MNTQTRPRLIAVLGCTGTIGSEVMRNLAQRSCSVRGILRPPPRSYPVLAQERPARVSYVVADHTAADQLQRAFSGADALFLLMGTHPGQVQSESLAIEAAQRAGVRRIIKLSAPVVAAPATVEVARWHRAVEAKLAASGLEHCSLRPYALMQNWLRNTATITRLGAIIGSAGGAPRTYVDCRDVAAVACDLLLSDAPPSTAAIDITGPESISNQEMAERISQVSGSAVRYDNLSRDEHYQMLLRRARLPEWLARHIVELEELAIRTPEPPANSVAGLLAQHPRTMDEFLHEQRHAFLRKGAFDPLRVLFGRRAGQPSRP